MVRHHVAGNGSGSETRVRALTSNHAVGYGNRVTTASELPAKIDIARALLVRGSVFVHLDPRHEGVCVPEYLRMQPQLVLQVGFNLVVPIPDLRFDAEGLSATLSFQRTPFYCEVPWEAIFALTGDEGEGLVWPESLPEEIHAEVDREVGRRVRPRDARRTPGPRLAPSRLAPRAEPESTAWADDSLSHDEEAPAHDAPAHDAPTPAHPAAELRVLDGARAKQPRQRKPGERRPEIPPYLRVIK